jgi:hypothetical protein
MPIIDAKTPTRPSPLQRRAAQHKKQLQSKWDELAKLFESLGYFIWKDKDPQSVLNAFGTDAADLFKCSSAYRTMVQSYTGTAPASPIPKGWSYTLNSDGTVTVTAPVPA